MWENFSQRARRCDSYASAAEEVLWLFRQLKPSVLNEKWLECLPDGTDTFVARCQACTEKGQVSKSLPCTASPPPPSLTNTHEHPLMRKNGGRYRGKRFCWEGGRCSGFMVHGS